MNNNAPKDCAECERLALISAMKAVRAQKLKEGDKAGADDLWQDIQFHQRHTYRHTCKGAS